MMRLIFRRSEPAGFRRFTWNPVFLPVERGSGFAASGSSRRRSVHGAGAVKGVFRSRQVRPDFLVRGFQRLRCPDMCSSLDSLLPEIFSIAS